MVFGSFWLVEILEAGLLEVGELLEAAELLVLRLENQIFKCSYLLSLNIESGEKRDGTHLKKGCGLHHHLLRHLLV